ncbi:MinD/ParA family ATP-binding protein [Rhodococcus opacus]|uniref:MinD-like ATPase involved in chromosome partitioning or flagellar assembly n=1 Tax=Rhodococcus opacus (strain B4) TaxID=632772 RepID=C1BE66_RHOOB|nr:hypothetical protein [Rhodococcus opacus]BAH56106.1 hypothetical protein ROP_pKNR-00140 [Rhodococcus opacus B4]
MSTEPEWMQWLNQEPEPETDLPPAAVVPLRGADSPASSAPAEHPAPAPRDQDPQREAADTPVWPQPPITAPPLVLVTGVGGGAGATTTAIGIAGAWATHDASSSVAVVDLTVTGGDLRSRASIEDLVTTIDTLIESVEPEALVSDLPLSAAGARVVDRGDSRFDDPVVHRVPDLLRSHVDTAVYDLGADALGSRECVRLREDADAVFVLVVQARADAFNRLRGYLDLLANAVGESVFEHTVVVISHQNSAEPDVDPAELVGYLSGRVRATLEVPYDPHLATGLEIASWELRAATVGAYDRIRRATASAEGRQ